jgi:hypothetical protein
VIYLLAWFGVGLCIALLTAIILLPRQIHLFTIFYTIVLWPAFILYVSYLCLFRAPSDPDADDDLDPDSARNRGPRGSSGLRGARDATPPGPG